MRPAFLSTKLAIWYKFSPTTTTMCQMQMPWPCTGPTLATSMICNRINTSPSYIRHNRHLPVRVRTASSDHDQLVPGKPDSVHVGARATQVSILLPPKPPPVYHSAYCPLLSSSLGLLHPGNLTPHSYAPYQSRYLSNIAASPAYPGLSLYSIKKFLRNKGVDYTESHPCLRVTLPTFTLGQAVTTQWNRLDENVCNIFINKVTGSFVCPELAVTGTWTQLECLLSAWVSNRNSKKTAVRQSYPAVNRLELNLPETVRQVWDRAVGVEKLTAVQFKDLLHNFKQIKRDFEIDHFSKFEVRVNQELTVMYFPVKYITGEIVGLKRLTVEDSCLVEDSLPSGGPAAVLPFIHNLDTAWATKTTQCVLVGSVLDSVVLSARTNMTVLCLADWTSLPPDMLAYLEQFTTITIWLGSGVQGVETAKSFARKMDDSRCRIVTSEWPSALQSVRKKEDVTEILASATTQHHQYITTFDTLRHDVFLEFLQAEEMQGVKWKRFEPLNSILKGFRRGEMTVITGRTGSGKTTFMSEYSLDLCMQGVSTLWGSFEVKNVRLVKMMLKQFGLVNLDENYEEFDKVAEKFLKLPLFFTTFHGTQELEMVLDAMAHAVYVHDIAHVIIDNIQFMVGTRGGNLDRFAKQDQCIEQFRKFATLHNVHVTLVIHPRKDAEEKLSVHSIFGGGKATQEADNVLLLQEESKESSFAKTKYIEVAKNRYAGDLGMIPLYFTKPVLSFSKKIADTFKKEEKKRKKTIKIAPQNVSNITQVEQFLVNPKEGE